MANITGKFNWMTQEITPAFVAGEDAKAIFDATEGIRSGTMGYNAETKMSNLRDLFKEFGLTLEIAKDGHSEQSRRDLLNQFFSPYKVVLIDDTSFAHLRNILGGAGSGCVFRPACSFRYVRNLFRQSLPCFYFIL